MNQEMFRYLHWQGSNAIFDNMFLQSDTPYVRKKTSQGHKINYSLFTFS